MAESVKGGTGGYGKLREWVLWALIVGLSILPLKNTVNEFVTRIVIMTNLAGHIIRLSIEIFDGFGLTYVLEYDSEERHSYLDLPGIVIPENLTHLMYPGQVMPLVTSGLGRRKRDGSQL